MSFVYGLVLLFVDFLFRVMSESRKSVTSLRQISRQAITKLYVVQKSSGEFHIVNTVMSRVSECNIFSRGAS